jgi:DNA-binding GntR family transcriptional regulator
MTLMQAVEKRLRGMILGMEIGPGERLTERAAEALLGASRTSVRAALMRLEGEGLVRREGRSWMVTPIDLDELRQLFAYREILEVAAIRLAVEVVDAEAVARIEVLLDGCSCDATADQALAIGTAYHVMLAGLSGNDFIRRGVADAMTRMSRARWLEIGPSQPGWAEHRAILNALKDHNPEQAVSLLSGHIQRTRDRLLAALDLSRRSLRARGVLVA